ncbi:MAG: hypothetical protein AAAFM81_08110 [Pseudomonadota bacterium]
MSHLDEIRDLLFGQEKAQLAKLDERVTTPELRSEDVAAILPQAIQRSHEAGPALARRLRPPVDACIKSGLREAPQEYADALYPIMGPAIRRSIAETFKAYAQQINQTMEQSLSLKYLRWRFEASRAGIPFAQYIMQKTLQYRVEQGYLIQRDSGLLIAHVHQEAAEIKDNDAVSAMFTAIQDFVKDSFSPDQSGRLEVAEMGEFALWAVHGPEALLVCVIRGVAPKSLRSELQGLLERLHTAYETQLAHYNGDAGTVTDVAYDLAECLQWQAVTEKKAKTSLLRKPGFWLALALIGLLAWWLYGQYQKSMERQALTRSFEAVPGIYLDRIVNESGTLTIYGLRDPLAQRAETIVAESGLSNLAWQSQLRPYRSLDLPIVRQRVEAALDLPQSLDGAWQADTFAVSGVASKDWIARASTLATSGQFAASIDLSGVVPEAVATVDPLIEFQTMLSMHASTTLQFSEGTQLVEPGALAQLEQALLVLASEARDLNRVVSVQVTGSADATGVPATNQRVANARAEFVASRLRRRLSNYAVTISVMPADLSEAVGVHLRRATVVVTEAAQ